MKRCSILIAVILLLLMCSSEALAWNLPIEVLSVAEDKIVRRFALALKERIQRSSFFSTTTDSSQQRLRVFVNAFDATDSIGIYSIVISWDNPPTNPFPLLLNNYVGICMRNRVHETAESSVASIVQTVEDVLKIIQRQRL